jgi:saccharopine dehydrogenase (NAD+, L-lysine-forming)
MKILALGCGAMGKVAIRDLVEHGNFGEIIVADYDAKKAEEYVRRLGDRRLKAEFVDVTDRAGLVKLMKRADLAVSTVGPFYKYGLAVVEAAIEAGISLVDICDDYDVTPKVLELHGKAKAKGITIITGLGASPGATNLLAKLGAQRLDEPEEVHIGLVQSAADPEGGPAVIYHVFHSMFGQVPTYCDGRYTEVAAFVDGAEKVAFPELGEFELYHIGHPEPLTLPRYFPSLKHVDCKLALNPPLLRDMVVGLGEMGLISSEALEVKGVELSPVDFFVAYLGHLSEEPLLKGVPYEGAVRVEVRGKKDGKPARAIYTAQARMNEGTGVPLSAGAQMLAAGLIKERGVFAPEGCIDPLLFIKEMVKRGFTGLETIETQSVKEFKDLAKEG